VTNRNRILMFQKLKTLETKGKTPLLIQEKAENGGKLT